MLRAVTTLREYRGLPGRFWIFIIFGAFFKTMLRSFISLHLFFCVIELCMCVDQAKDKVASCLLSGVKFTTYRLKKSNEMRQYADTWSVRKVSDLWPGKRNWLTWSVGHLITLKVVPLELHTLLPAVPPLLEACQKSLFRNGV